MDIQTLVNNGYDYLMDSAYNRISKGIKTTFNGEPYSPELLENLRKHFENKEEYRKCLMIKNLKEELFGHNNNYV